MTRDQFYAAMQIISQYHSTKLIINYVKSGGSVGDIEYSPRIHMTDCCAGLIKELIDRNYSLSMQDGMIHVDRLPNEPLPF